MLIAHLFLPPFPFYWVCFLKKLKTFYIFMKSNLPLMFFLFALYNINFYYRSSMWYRYCRTLISVEMQFSLPRDHWACIFPDFFCSYMCIFSLKLDHIAVMLFFLNCGEVYYNIKCTLLIISKCTVQCH